MARAHWWIYDEEDRERPGWRHWRARGLFKSPPGRLHSKQDCFALCESSDGGLWRAFMLRPESLSLHEVEKESKWGPAHLSLLGAGVEGLPQSWVKGSAAMMVEIDELPGLDALLGGAHQSHLVGLAQAWERAKGAPLLWGKGEQPCQGYAVSLDLWRQECKGHADRGFLDCDLAALARRGRAEAAMLRGLAAGASSPALQWMQVLGDPRWAKESWFKASSLLAARMESLEIQASSQAGAPSLKAKRL